MQNMEASTEISRPRLQGSLATSIGFKSWRDPLTSWWTHKILKEKWWMFSFQGFLSWVKQNENFKLLKKLEQENEEESSVGWRMELIYLSLMYKWLKNTRNKVGRRRSKTELSSLKVELMQKWWMKGSNFLFSHNGQEDKAYASRWQGFVTLEWPLGWPFWTCHFMLQMDSFTFCKTTKNGRDKIC